MSRSIQVDSGAQMYLWNVYLTETDTICAGNRFVRCGCVESNARTSQKGQVSRLERSSCTAYSWGFL